MITKEDIEYVTSKGNYSHAVGAAFDLLLAERDSALESLKAERGMREKLRILLGRIHTDLKVGFVRCTHCGEQEDTKDFDILKDIEEVLALQSPRPGAEVTPDVAAEGEKA